MATSRLLIPECRFRDLPSSVIIVEASGGPARRRWLDEYLEAMGPKRRKFAISCSFDSGGPWAGVKDIFSALLPEIQAQRPELMTRHALELIYILPRLRRSLVVRNPSLTDLASRTERTRNYAADRAVRIVHGLIDLLDSWISGNAEHEGFTIAADNYDEAGEMCSRFFSELMRRRGEQLKLNLVLAVAKGKGTSVKAAFTRKSPVEVIEVDLPGSPDPPLDPESAAGIAAELEQHIGTDQIELQASLPDLVRLWGLSGHQDKLLRYKFMALDTYNTLGLYKDALRYGEGILPLAKKQKPQDKSFQWMILFKLLMCHMGIQDVETSLKLALEDGLALVESQPASKVRLFYVIAMFYGRYMKPRDLKKGEEYLDRALQALEQADLPPGEYHFHYCFNRNGLAMIRNFQGRHEDAIELCRQGMERLNQHLSPHDHRLHRSVLLYNIAQVYAATRSYDDAIRYYSAAMEMDPNYSEYYNERGNIQLQLGRLEEARASYLQAIELSPPYFEVFTNLGQCYRLAGNMKEAIASYSRALDLEPDQVVALLGRAKAHEELGHMPEAIEDYTAVLERDPKRWEAVASRGIMHYELGNLKAALADFDRAISLRQGEADLHLNRATVLEALGLHAEAASALETALGLGLSEDDRKMILQKIQSLRTQPV